MTEQLAFPIRPQMGEVDGFVIYPGPDIKVLEKLRKNKSRTELWDNLPNELGYNNQKLEKGYADIEGGNVEDAVQ